MNRIQKKSIWRYSLLSLSIFVSIAKASYGFEIGSGVSAVEDGDDRVRPAAVIHASTASGITNRFLFYGRDFGPVKERNYVLSISKRWDVGSKTWQGLVGGAVMADQTEITFPNSPADNTSYTSTNFGMNFGLHWLAYETKVVQLKATWDGYIFPAGTGFIFLANARKSALGLMLQTQF
ncbi:MAG: hypothetical protein NT027_10510 [Proteobacteria bacterium]|nr:hypothetical protein [Pseudomonadota bacterium]